jgi:hypothetical protein
MSESHSNGGIGVLGLLGVAFVVLKLIGVINWSWWLVTMPFWGGFILAILGIGIVVSLEALNGRSGLKRRRSK